MIVCVFALSMAMGSYASAYTQKRGACTRCGTENTSFGYDPIFYVDLDGPSNAQLPMEEKNQLSHRGKALRAMKKGLL